VDLLPVIGQGTGACRDLDLTIGDHIAAVSAAGG